MGRRAPPVLCQEGGRRWPLAGEALFSAASRAVSGWRRWAYLEVLVFGSVKHDQVSVEAELLHFLKNSAVLPQLGKVLV